MQRKQKEIAKKFDNVGFCVRPLCELQLLYKYIRPHHSGTDMAISLLHFTSFFQGEDKSIERGENHYKSGHVQSFSYVDGKIVGLLHASRRERDGKYVFLIVLSLQPLN